jgi:hypothetical protein
VRKTPESGIVIAYVAQASGVAAAAIQGRKFSFDIAKNKGCFPEMERRKTGCALAGKYE